jgi:hypothetical protein
VLYYVQEVERRREQLTDCNPTDFAGALALFKHATATLNSLWDSKDGDILGDTYPKCLPSFDEFIHDVMAMEIQTPKPELPDLPPVGTLVRARYDLDCGGHGVWRAGWDGFIVSHDIDSVSVESYRYLGPGMHEWNNCRVISGDDAYGLYEHDFGRRPVDQDDDALLAYALLQEFEVI